jgi:hypothetical protein
MTGGSRINAACMATRAGATAMASGTAIGLRAVTATTAAVAGVATVATATAAAAATSFAPSTTAASTTTAIAVGQCDGRVAWLVIEQRHRGCGQRGAGHNNDRQSPWNADGIQHGVHSPLHGDPLQVQVNMTADEIHGSRRQFTPASSGLTHSVSQIDLPDDLLLVSVPAAHILMLDHHAVAQHHNAICH